MRDPIHTELIFEPTGYDCCESQVVDVGERTTAVQLTTTVYEEPSLDLAFRIPSSSDERDWIAHDAPRVTSAGFWAVAATPIERPFLKVTCTGSSLRCGSFRADLYHRNPE